MAPPIPVPGAAPAAPAPAPAADLLGVVDQGVRAADEAALTEEQIKARETEENEVKALWKEYETARAFDRDARAQYAVDRRYAAGTAGLDWAVSANLIGAFIDILVSFLYARNPDVSVRKSPRVDSTGTLQEEDFAKTVELVVSSLWKAPTTRLKNTVRAQVRSTLTSGAGWLKVILLCKGDNIPQMQTQLNDLRKNISDLEAQRVLIAEQAELQPDNENLVAVAGASSVQRPEPGPTDAPPDAKSPAEIDADLLKLRELETSLSQKVEVALRKALAVDFVAPEDVQVSLDVRSITDYTSASWVANSIYRPVSTLRAMFPHLTDADMKHAKQYFQRRTRDLTPLSERVALTGIADSSVNADEAEQYVSDSSRAGVNPDEQGPAFAKIVELWDRNTNHVKTMIDGVHRWAKAPYQPDYPTTRFFPYFMLEFYPVDGARHPQSLPWRLRKLQDEYCSVRSSQRLTRQRAVPGTLFNSSALSPEDARKIEHSTHQEYIGIKPTSPDQPLRDLFAAKPVEVGDMRLYDTTMILSDMERISGVQEALQQSSTAPKTATEAEIQQTGFMSRTTADRDTLEAMLNDLAHYTAELSLSGLDADDATRVAGARAFWPQGMSLDDLLTMVEIQIEAGTTGKPKSAGDKDAWGIVLPLLKETLIQVQQAQMTGNLPLAKALTELVRETMVRLGDETDVSRFIPQPTEMLPPMPGAPGAPGGPPPGGGPGAPAAPGAPLPGAEDPGLDPMMVAPEMVPPEMIAPDMSAPPV